ncbi:MAG: redoxin domain-containing protein [Bdellovibrionales bacterium]|nr:redoxin domain-containing protein [Bdellovibrionales bacterium]
MIWLTVFLSFWTGNAIAFPELVGTDLFKGGEVAFDVNGDRTVVMFLSSTCGCTLTHLKHIQKLRSEFPDTKFVSVVSNADEDLENTRKLFAKSLNGVSIVRDGNQKIADQFKAVKTPQTYVLKSGEIVYSGPITNSSDANSASEFYVEEVLTNLKNGKPLPYKAKKALGCYINRS